MTQKTFKVKFVIPEDSDPYDILNDMRFLFSEQSQFLDHITFDKYFKKQNEYEFIDSNQIHDKEFDGYVVQLNFKEKVEEVKS